MGVPRFLCAPLGSNTSAEREGGEQAAFYDQQFPVFATGVIGFFRLPLSHKKGGKGKSFAKINFAWWWDELPKRKRDTDRELTCRATYGKK